MRVDSSTGVMDGAGAPWAGVVPQRLRPPRQRGTSLERSDLLGRLAEVDTPIVAIGAGAGYGKTTLLRQWARSRTGPTGWLGLDRTDDDPVVLLRHVAAALSDCGVDVDAVVAALSRHEPQISRSVLPALGAALERCELPFLLVLDDVHEVSSRESLAALDELLDMVPATSTVALSARRFPALRLSRRLLDGVLTELDEDDLAFRPDESVSVMAAELPALSDQQLGDLAAYLEGWPAGVHLAVLALRDHPEPHSVVRGMVATDKRVVDYLQEEVLGRLDGRVRGFLVQASVLDRLARTPCDEILDRHDSSELLEEVARSGNLFVHSSDVADEHRLHELYRQLLLLDLRRQDPGAERRLRRRAAWWYHEHGDPDAAVAQALATGDAGFAGEMVYRQLFPALMSGATGTLGRWVAMFTPEQVQSDGLLALAAGWCALVAGRVRELEHHLAAARRATVDCPLPDGTVSFDVAVAALEMVAALKGTDAVARQARLVLHAGPGGSPWEGLAAFQRAMADGLLGRTDLVDALRGAEVATRGMPLAHAVCQAQLGWALLRSGEQVDGLAWIDRATSNLAAHELEEFALAAPVHGVASVAAAIRQDTERSEAAAAMAETSLQTMQHVTPRGRLHTRLLLADAAIRRGQIAEARRHLDRSSELLRVERATVVLQTYARELRQVVEREQVSVGVVDLTAAEQRVLEQLPTHRSLVEVGQHLYVSRNTVKTHTLSIYRKLGVSGRSEAVARAVELGLLSD